MNYTIIASLHTSHNYKYDSENKCRDNTNNSPVVANKDTEYVKITWSVNKDKLAHCTAFHTFDVVD